MEDYYERYWKNEINAGVMDKPPSHNIDAIQKKLGKIRKYLKGKCLDIGCGDGFITSELNKIIPTIGIDISDVAIQKARQKYRGIKFVKDSATDIPFESNSFGCICAEEIVEHILDTEAMFKEFNRILEKDGYLIITTPQMTRLKNIFISLFHWNTYYHPLNPHIRFYTKESMTEMLKKYGFKMVHYEPDGKFSYGVPKGMLVVAKKIK